MKKTIVLFLFMGVLTQTSCKKKTKTEEKNPIETTTLSNSKTKGDKPENKESTKKCDEFIADYEKWMEGYIDLISKYKDNPAGLIGDPDYTKVSMESVEWASKWANDLSCATNIKYQNHFSEVQERMEKKLKEVGLK